MANKRETLFANMKTATRNYNKSLSDLLSCLVAKSQKNPEIVAISEKFSAVKNIDEDVIIITSGPYLWKYRKEIVDKNQNLLLAQEFSEEVKSVSGKFGSNDVQKIIKIVKTLWKSMSPQEKEICWNHLLTCVKNYASYAGCSKQLKSQ